MELHRKLEITEEYNSSLEQDYKSYFSEAKRFALKYYVEDVERITNTNFSEVCPEIFLREAMWCVLVSGFRASVISKIWNKIYNGVMADFFDACIKNEIVDIKYIEARGLQIFNNKIKISAIISNAQLVGRKISELGWENYRDTELNSVEKLEVFKGVGPKISLHLGRNIGIDSVKDDIHLVRLANKFGFTTAEELCVKLAEENNMKKGIIDLCLWYFSSSFGSK